MPFTADAFRTAEEVLYELWEFLVRVDREVNLVAMRDPLRGLPSIVLRVEGMPSGRMKMLGHVGRELVDHSLEMLVGQIEAELSLASLH